MIIAFLFNLGYLVDFPTSYVSSRGSYEIEFRVCDAGKVIGRIAVSPIDNFMFGISYGGKGIIGKGTPEYNSSPGVQAKYGTTFSKLSLAIGYDSELYGNLPLGVYGVLGGDLSWRLIPYVGLGYKDSLNLFCGMDAGLAPSASLCAEGYIKDKKFSVNTGIRWVFEQQVIIEFDFVDVFNKEPIRSIKFSYIGYI
jgi:hypothetical protein